MFNFTKLSDSLHLRRHLEHSWRTTLDTMGALFRLAGESERGDEVLHTLLGLVKTLLQKRRNLTEEDLETLRRILSCDHPLSEVERFVAELRTLESISIEEAAPKLLSLSKPEREKILRILLAVAINNAGFEENYVLINSLGEKLNFAAEEVDKLHSEVASQQLRQQKIIRSGAGIIVAVIVLAVFVLTATLLRSVIFGLIGAYLLLPVEKYFEKRLRSHKGIGFHFFRLTGILFYPLQTISAKLSRKAPDSEAETPEVLQLKSERKIIKQALAMTTGLLILIILALLLTFSSVTRHYVQNWSATIQEWSQNNLAVPPPEPAVLPPGPAPIETQPVQPLALNPAPAPDAGTKQIFAKLSFKLEQLRIRFENLPLIRLGLDQMGKLLADDAAQRELAALLLKRTGGIFSFTASVLGVIAALLADLLLTVFFFLLFLAKLAEFCNKTSGANQESEYLIRTVFNGNWLPGAGEETVAEAQRIIGGMLLRLKIWVRGYLTLMLVDATVYTTVFFFLGVPYFPILGMVAGCGILLPYLGPVLSAILTVLVTLAAEGTGASGTQLAAIVAAYLLYNGVIEQFILYPAVIGESLGLTTLETIIVVLLGAIFAGIPGMILAIPAASIIKYLVPQIYNCFGDLRNYGSQIRSEDLRHSDSP